MGIPSRPPFLKEGPASACVLEDKALGWTLCTCLSCAMGMNKSTLGHVHMSGCDVRAETHDFSGGTTIPQVAAVAAAHGVKTEQHVGSGVCTPWYAAYQSALGRGYILQGNTHPDGRGNVNHAVWVNEPRGGTPGNPSGGLVYDPWSTGPAVWSWAKIKAFAAALHPWGEADGRTLGPGKFYCLIFPDTEPHVHLAFGGRNTGTFPDSATAYNANPARHVNVRKSPIELLTVKPVATLRVGAPFVAYQVTDVGRAITGTPQPRRWYGNHDGNGWVHSSGLKVIA